MSDYDVIIAGGGHNALACGAFLSLHGLDVLIAERNDWIGGGVVTREITLPGFKHDLFGSSHIWCHANPDYSNILRPELEKHGLEYIWAEEEITAIPWTKARVSCFLNLLIRLVTVLRSIPAKMPYVSGN